MKKILAVILAVFMLIGVLAGCGSDNGSDPTDGPSATGGTSGGTSGGPGGSPGQGNTGGDPLKDTLIISQNEEPTSFISIDSRFPASANKDHLLLHQLYDTLLFMRADGTITPALAERWEVSEDGLEYTFYLRQDVIFHNGDKMTAEDVAFTYNTALNDYASLAVTALTNMTHAEVVDEYTVKLVLSAPFAVFYKNVTGRLGYIVNKRVYEEIGAEEYMNQPIGTGPYMFESKVAGDNITLVAHEQYWGGSPQIKKVIIRPMTNPSTQFLALENGEIDVIVRADIASALQLNNPTLTWDFTHTSHRTILQIIAREPSPFADVNLRRAVQYAINRDDIVLGAYEGYANPLYSDVIPGYTGAPDISDLLTFEYDPDQARAYVAASSYSGEALQLMCVAGGPEERIAQIIQGQLGNVGINVEIMAVDASTRASLNRSGEGIDMHIDSSMSGTNDVSSLATQYRTTDARTPQWSRALCDAFDNFLWLADNEMDPEARKGHIAGLLNLAAEEAVIIPILQPVLVLAYNAALSNIEPHFGNLFFISEWTW